MSTSGMERLVEEIPVLGLLGFHDELDHRTGRPNGSMRDAVQPVGEPDEAELVAYLDACRSSLTSWKPDATSSPEAPTGTLRDALLW
ncbi:hypothetical protein [Streptomyces mirabilis]|uniref:hypothetical protein n=1 Tax=Streptomyces mirabilis TaxID=68239 RepID=UPI0036ACA020